MIISAGLTVSTAQSHNSHEDLVIIRFENRRCYVGGVHTDKSSQTLQLGEGEGEMNICNVCRTILLTTVETIRNGGRSSERQHTVSDNTAVPDISTAFQS